MGHGQLAHKLFVGLGHQPFILLFFVVAAGYALARVKIKGISLGATASSLIVGLALSLIAARAFGIKYQLAELTSTVFFNLFMFSIGMKVGPQFVSGLRRDAGKYIFFGLFIPLCSFALMFGVRALFKMEPGIGPGIFIGANTATPGLGAAQAAYGGGAVHLPQGVEKAAVLSNLSTAFAFSYCIGMVLFILFMKLPDLFGADTAAAGRAYEAQVQSGSAPLPGSADEFFGRPLPVAMRTYEIKDPQAFGRRVGELRRIYPFVAIERILRGGKLLVPTDDLVLQPRDTVALYGRVSRLLNAPTVIGPEVDAPEARDIGVETVDVIVQNRDAIGRTLVELAQSSGHGLFLNAMFRAGDEIPVGPDTKVRRGDVIRVTGGRWRIKILESEIGRVVRSSLSTDIVTLAVGLAIGGLIGMITIPLGSIKLTLGSAVGLLLTGIGLSTLRTRHPAFGGPYPEPARQLIEDLGLNVFISILGINAGAGVLAALSAGALTPILVGTLVVGLLPACVAWFLGRVGRLSMNEALLMGAVAGGRCNSAGMRAAQEATHSNVPAISYPVTFAISNVVLTLLAYVMAIVG
jgi:putative transport protein